MGHVAEMCGNIIMARLCDGPKIFFSTYNYKVLNNITQCF